MKSTIVLAGLVAVFSSYPSLASAQDAGSPTSVGDFESIVKTKGVTQKTEGENNTQDMAVGSVSGSQIGGKFFSNVEVKGDMTQTSNGSQNSQRIGLGSVENSEVGTYTNEKTETGAVKQTISGGGSGNRQDLSVGSVQGSSVKDFKSKITTGNLTQEVNGGNNNIQEMQIGSVNNSTVQDGTFNTLVETKKITQTSVGDQNTQTIQLGGLKNSEVGSFSSDVKVRGNIEQKATGSGHSQSATFGSVR